MKALVLAALLGAAALASTFSFTTLAGSGGTVSTSADGSGSDAQFDAPRGIAVDREGNYYVADTRNNIVRKITPSGVVTTLAGTGGTEGGTNGTGAQARFNEPFGVAVDDAGSIYVADASNNAVRKITAAGVVTTFAGGNGAGSADGTGTSAQFDEPRGICIDSTGTLYIADYDNHTIRKITTAGVVTTLAGRADVPGNADGVGTAASFRGPMGIAVDATGIVYVADTGNRSIRRISASGTVTTVSLSGSTLSEPRGVAVTSSGTILVADYGSHTIRSISSSGTVTTLAGAIDSPGTADGASSSARFHYPSALALLSDGSLAVADTDNDTIRGVRDNVVRTIAGRAGRVLTADGQGTNARFDAPYATAVDSTGVVYVADTSAHVIRRIGTDGVVTTFAGLPGSFGIDDGTADGARFYSPTGVAVDSSGNLYVADSMNSTIRKITPGRVVTTLAGTGRARGNTDGTGAAARFSQPFGVAVDGAGTVYVTDSQAGTIRKITSAGVVTTLAGQAGSAGSTDGTGASARFTVPYAIVVDSTGTLFVVDHGNHTIRRVTATGVVTTLAGTAGSSGSTDGTGTAARFNYPSGITVARDGTLYVADTDNQTIRALSASGEVTTVGGTSNRVGSTDGSGTAARFFNPKGISIGLDGKLYIADLGNRAVRLGTPQ
jgi:sugar lactone lactonase YvrE